MRLIDADVLMPNAEYKGRYDTVNAYDIVNCPTVDAEPVIRCKDCKFNPEKTMLGCPMAGSMTRNDDSFCSWAERKEEE